MTNKHFFGKPLPIYGPARSISIPKGNGKSRSICLAPESLKKWLRELGAYVTDKYLLQCHWLHGFMPLRSPVTNAKAHIGYEFTLSMDLQDFFDSITLGKLRKLQILTDNQLLAVTHEGRLRQGFASSPALANYAALEMDRKIMAVLKGLDATAVYTRYADDLCISTNDWSVVEDMSFGVAVLAGSEDFAVNAGKTHTQCAKAGRRMICGVAVDRCAVYCPRAIRRRIRSARHKISMGSSKRLSELHGLEEWSKLKEPMIGRAGREASARLYHALRAEKYDDAVTAGFRLDCVLGATSDVARSRVVEKVNRKIGSGTTVKQDGEG